MNTIRNFTFTLLFLSLCFPLSGIAQDSEKASSILQASKAAFDQLEDFSADITYALANPSNPNSNISKEGKLHYSKGKYTVLMADQEIYCDGETMWIHLPAEDPADSEVNILEYDPEEGLDLESIFSLYQAGSKNRYDGDAKVHGVSCHKIYMAITDQDLEFNQVELWINKRTELLEKAITTNRRQIKTIFEFENMKTNQNLPASTFSFNTQGFAGEVYDER
jgi:outer membrane lipoprotein-sorting protein